MTTSKLNYRPEDVQSSEVLIASMAGSGVTFGILPHKIGQEPEMVVISPRQASGADLRIGDTVEVGYVENYPEYADKVRWRAVAVYRKTDGSEKPARGAPVSPIRKTVEQQIEEVVLEGEVWNRGEMYKNLFGETYVNLVASDAERAKYVAVGHSLARLHDTGKIACAKIYGPGKKNATSLYYAKDTHILGRALLGLDLNANDPVDEEDDAA